MAPTIVPVLFPESLLLLADVFAPVVYVAALGSAEVLVRESSEVGFAVDLVLLFWVFGIFDVDPSVDLETVDAGVLGDVGVLGVSDVDGG